MARVGHLVDFDLLHASMCGSQAIAATSVTYANASTRSRVTDNLCNFSFTTTRWRCYVASWRARPRIAPTAIRPSPQRTFTSFTSVSVPFTRSTRTFTWSPT
ncbi:hypothetical protein C6Q22_21040 [Burkholderia multivorans]|nr:hypothetical protein C6Q22_21040 [Burkholderia multivorans]PRG67290.1 hypothetical protein C6T69_18755 [Burkholderia multivorans]